MKKYWVSLILLTLITSACSLIQQPTPEPTFDIMAAARQTMDARGQLATTPDDPMTYPTYTPYPTYTFQPTYTSLPAITLPPPTNTTAPFFASIRVDSWLFEINEIRVDPGDSGRKIIVIIGYLTNNGMRNDTFTAFGSIDLQDSHGRLYEEDDRASSAAQDKYGTEYGASMDPEVKEYYLIAFNVPIAETNFTLVKGSLAASWSGDVNFTVP